MITLALLLAFHYIVPFTSTSSFDLGPQPVTGYCAEHDCLLKI